MYTKQLVLDKFCEALQTTRQFGFPEENSLKEIRYLKRGEEEYAVPIFADGTGEPNDYWPNGYYAVNITGDSGVAIILDITENFVRRM